MQVDGKGNRAETGRDPAKSAAGALPSDTERSTTAKPLTLLHTFSNNTQSNASYWSSVAVAVIFLAIRASLRSSPEAPTVTWASLSSQA